MTRDTKQTVLILGASGRFGRNAAEAFAAAGWLVREFDRATDRLEAAAQGVDVIVNAWNPEYPDWADLVPKLHAEVIAVAKVVGATVIVPGNVYVFGPEVGSDWGVTTPHRATNPLGGIRRDMEQAYRDSGVRTIVLRAGDFIDTEASGNWFDMIMTKAIAKGKFTYLGRTDIAHAWAYLPDLTRAAVMLAEMRSTLNRFEDVPFAGYTMSGEDLATALSEVTGKPVRIKQFDWWMIKLAKPLWKLASSLLEMRYLWNTPHALNGARFDELLPDFVPTELHVALARALPQEVVSLKASVQKSRSTQTIR